MKQACCCQAQFAASANRGFEFDKGGQFFIRMHNEALTAGQGEEGGTVSGQL
jgi:hypothetical protein